MYLILEFRNVSAGILVTNFLNRRSRWQTEHRCGDTMCPRAAVHAVYRLLVDNRGVTPISYRDGCLVVDWGDGRLHAFTENGRGLNHDHATFDRALERSLLDGFLVRGLVVALI